VFCHGVCYKSSGIVKGQRFDLSRAERIALLQDEVLGKFSWVYRGGDDDNTVDKS
jgi:hypothetical protein